ncbi:hypothetical protein [Bradyrhizobium sp. th.b2]|uniref:hypothetical protein n=1 Tax=Bradyrhizobium sp. th-b2 TaxID=172088 RepID=UPI0003FE7B64|nr:hypothetical protein [Bradyrhizobium sp. th.b2]
MPVTRKPIEIPPAIGRRFAAQLEAYHTEQDANRRDEIAAETRHMLMQHMPAGSKLRMSEVKELFALMRFAARAVLPATIPAGFARTIRTSLGPVPMPAAALGRPARPATGRTTARFRSFRMGLDRDKSFYQLISPVD